MQGDLALFSLAPLMPELYMVLGGFVLLLYGLYASQRISLPLVFGVSLVFVGAAFVVSLGMDSRLITMNGMVATDGFTRFAKLLILFSAVLTLLISTPWLLEQGGRPFEFVILMLFATLGMMLMVSAADFMAVYVAVELAALALYVLASFERDSSKSTEAGLKYFVLGALASGMMLFGISLIYGFTGSTSFNQIASILQDSAGGSYMAAANKAAVVGMVMVIVGFCFKLSAVPFHMWAPDVYEGAPTPVTAFFATAPKIAALVLFVRVLLWPFGALIEGWQQVVVFVSVASMVVGALGAIAQSNIKRLLAYSSIGHVGFMLMAVAAGSTAGLSSMLLYLALYMFMSIGAFACVLLMRRRGTYVEEIVELSGLAHQRPWMAFAIAAFMLSMAGIPPLAGFFGKMYVLMAAVEAGLTWLAVVGVLTSVVSCYYYLRVIKIMYFDDTAAAFDAVRFAPLKAALGLSTFVTVFFFLAPEPLLAGARTAAMAMLQ